MNPHNNSAELFIRPFSMGSSNWFFSDTDTRAEASSVIYTLEQNAKLSKINEFDYLWPSWTGFPCVRRKRIKKSSCPGR
jgi:hypothetical protein